MQWNVTASNTSSSTDESQEAGSTFTIAFDVPNDTKGVVTLPVMGNTTVDGVAVTVGEGGALESQGGVHVVVVQT